MLLYRNLIDAGRISVAFMLSMLVLLCGIAGQAKASTSYSGINISLDKDSTSMTPTNANAGITGIKIGSVPILGDHAYFSVASMDGGFAEKIAASFKFVSGTEYTQTAVLTQAGLRVFIRYKCIRDFLEITASLHSTSKGDRGWRLALHLPLQKLNWEWEPGLNVKLPFDTGPVRPEEGKKYPLSVLTSASVGFALGIPVKTPAFCNFYRSGDEIVLELPLGTSSLTQPYPNTSIVKMHLWHIEPAWGFRQALDDYYSRFPQVYKRRNTQAGLWSTGDPEGLDNQAGFLFHEHGNCWFSNNDSSARDLNDQTQIDAGYGWKTFPYLIAGQMSRVQLNALPLPTENINEFLKGQPEIYSPQPFSQFAFLGLGEADYRNVLSASRLLDPLQLPIARPRDIVMEGRDPETGALVKEWRTIGKSVTFPVNPSPRLLVGNVRGHGAILMQWAAEALDKYPGIAGLYVDSNTSWSGFKNYRAEHFNSCPNGNGMSLAADDTGGVYLPNAWGQYQFLLELSTLLHGKGKILFGNGNYSGTAGSFTEGSTNMFFLASLMDVLGDDQYRATLSIKDYLLRSVAGPKLVLRLGSGVGFKNSDTVRKYINSCLSLGFLPSTWGSYFAKPAWLNGDESFCTQLGGWPNSERDAAHWSKVFSVVNSLGQAAWKPVTLARCDAAGAQVERFQKGKANYFTVFSITPRQSVQVSFECGRFQSPTVRDLFTNKLLTPIFVNGCYSVTVPLANEESALTIIKVTDG